MSARGAYEDWLAAYVGAVLQERTPAPDPVNVPMIRHWVEAMEPADPVHLDADAAPVTGRDDLGSDDLEIGMPLSLRWLDADPHRTLPVLGPRSLQED